MSNDTGCRENRELFFKRLQPYFAPSILNDVQLAYTLAKFGHRAQVRKEVDIDGVPIRYFEHVRRVTIILIDEVKVIRQELIIASLLHDGIEDTRDLTPEMIEHCFGTDVVNIVKVLSKDPKENYLDRFYTCNDWRPYLIKACDRLDNLRSLNVPGTSESFRQKQVQETQEKYFPLFDRMLELTPNDILKRAQLIRDEIRHETSRQITLLEMC